MPDKPCHRGEAPQDDRLFAADQWPTLREATRDLCWLLSRGYAIHSASELVGNRYTLRRRQRDAVGRCACSRQSWERRRQHQLAASEVRSQDLWLDGYNVLTAIETALSGGVILLGCDGCCRDLASIHAHYRKVVETIPALRLVAETTACWEVHRCCWWLDRPVSNSGRLKTVILEVAAETGKDWQVELVNNPDRVLSQSEQVVVTSDSAILDRCQRWFNLARELVIGRIPHARSIDLDVYRSDGHDETRDGSGPPSVAGQPGHSRWPM